MESPDEFGILAEYCRVSATESLTNILWEIIANRKHNIDKSQAKFLFMNFGEYFVLGTNHFRDRESIEKEHTPFKFNESKKENNAAISARGYGAKLFPFFMSGEYCNIFRSTDASTFTTELKEWSLKDWIDIDQLHRIVNNNEKFEKESFRSRFYTPIISKAGRNKELPFFCEENFQASQLAKFVETHNFKYFYVFVRTNPVQISQIRDSLSELCKIYDGHDDVKIYYSNNYEMPYVPSFTSGLGILQKDWTSALVFNWKLGSKKQLDGSNGQKVYWLSEFCLTIPNTDVCLYGKNDSNGSADTKFSYRFASFNPSSDWKPQVRVTIAVTTPDYPQVEKAAEHIYLKIDDDLISFREADPNIASKLRNLKTPSRMRAIVDILEESLKTNPDAGLSIANVKAKSQIISGKGIHEMILQSLSLFRNYQSKIFEQDNTLSNSSLFTTEERINDLRKSINKNLAAANRSVKRKREALVFENAIYEYLRENFFIEIDSNKVDVSWEDNDATISVNHDIEGEAIDTLGKISISQNSKVWVLIQSKDHEKAITPKKLDTFISCVNEFRKKKQEINPNDKIIPILALAKSNSFSYKVFEHMQKNGIHVVIDDETPGEKTYNLIMDILTNYVI